MFGQYSISVLPFLLNLGPCQVEQWIKVWTDFKMYKIEIWNKKGQFGAQARKVDAKVKVGYSEYFTC